MLAELGSVILSHRALLGPQELSTIWEEYLAVGGDWTKSKYALKLANTKSFERVGARRWMTRKQLIAKYEDEEVVDAIIEQKRSDPLLARTEIKPHPDAPLREAFGQHLESITCFNSIGIIGISLISPMNTSIKLPWMIKLIL